MSDEPSSAGLDATMRDFVSGQKVFNRYTLIRTLGRGGMGIVWLAHDDDLDRDVALKFLPEIIVHDRAIVEDLKRETKRCLELTHKNIIRIHDFVQNVISACISMEYVEGDTVSNLRADKAARIFEPEELKPWLSQLCEALDYAHNHARIIHRDLKPSNLMISKRGQLKVADFGIARSLSDSVSMLTHSQGTSGTLVYMSPQQLDGLRATHLDDIYSLGATIYELLTSKPPFYSGDIGRQIHQKTAPSMTERRKDLEVDGSPIPKNWEETIAACLAKDPTQRAQSVMEVASRLGLIKRYESNVVPQAVKPARDKPHSISRTIDPPKKSFLIPIVTTSLIVLAAGWLLTKTEQENITTEPVQVEVTPTPAVNTPSLMESPAATKRNLPIADPIARASQEIAKCEKYRATWARPASDNNAPASGTDEGTIWILKRPSDELLAALPAGGLVTGVSSAVFSKDGEYFAYAVGGGSLGTTAVQLFRINQESRVEEIKLMSGEQSRGVLDVSLEFLRKNMRLRSGGFFDHSYCTPISISDNPLTLTFDLYVDRYSPENGASIQINKATRFTYRVDTNALDIVGPLPNSEPTSLATQSALPVEPPPPKVKKLFAGTWVGVLHPFDVNKKELPGFRTQFTVNENETEVIINTEHLKGWTHTGSHTLSLTQLPGKFARQTSITIHEDGKSADYKMNQMGSLLYRGTFNKK